MMLHGRLSDPITNMIFCIRKYGRSKIVIFQTVFFFIEQFCSWREREKRKDNNIGIIEQ